MIGIVAAAAAIALLAGSSSAGAQTLGTFRWQLVPYCNVVTVTIAQQGGVFTLDGFDDQCGAGQRASVVGTAFPNPDGTIGIGLNTVLAPGGAFVHVEARIGLASLNGPWRDSVGNSGTFTFTPGAGAGGPQRPVATNGIAPGSITAAQLAPGTLTAAQIDASQIQTRVVGSCLAGQYMRAINPNGSVVCEGSPENVTTTILPVIAAAASIAIGTDALPIVSHGDVSFESEALLVTHCGNMACTSGNVTTTVDDPDSPVRSISMAIGDDGRPIIAYGLHPSGIRVTHCGNVTCTAGNVSRTIDPGSNLFTSLAIGADGLPIITYIDGAVSGLRITHCGNATCTAGNVSTTVDDVANWVGMFPSIAIGSDGLPVISHLEFETGGGFDVGWLRLTHCGNVACTAGNTSERVAGAADASVNGGTSIAIGTDGLPIISTSIVPDGSRESLRVTHCGNLTCTSGNVSTTVYSPPNRVGRSLSLAIGADGLPVISHHDDTASTLLLTHCVNVTCTSGTVTATADDPVNRVGTFSSLAIGQDGMPIISYYDATAKALRVTKCATTTCIAMSRLHGEP